MFFDLDQIVLYRCMTNNNEQKFDAEFDRIDAIRSASEDLREQRTFDIAVGGLTVSIGIFTYLVTHAEKIPSRWMIIAIMACFGLAVVLNYYSHILSTRSMEKILRRINAHKKNGDIFNARDLQKEENDICRFGTVLNWVVSALILAGVVLIVIYGIKYVLL